ncbi:MAG: hypothetical protein P1U56_05785 [Saprospiraceae bacterium]|nr:hypothetical protein [Saprospiraceae bacterium]
MRLNKINLKVLAVLFVLLVCSQLPAQQPKTKESPSQSIQITQQILCKKGELDAQKDIREQDLGYYFYGRPSPRFNTWMRIMRETYPLKIKGGGDIISEEGVCYNQIIHQKLKEKYGPDVITIITSKLDSLYAAGLGDRHPEYKGGEKALLNYIYCNIPDSLLSHNPKEIPQVVYKITITKEGEVENNGMIHSNAHSKGRPKYGHQADIILADLPKWIPGIENKQNVGFKVYYLPFKFDLRMKHKHCLLID